MDMTSMSTVNGKVRPTKEGAPKRFYTVPEAAELLRVSEVTCTGRSVRIGFPHSRFGADTSYQRRQSMSWNKTRWRPQGKPERGSRYWPVQLRVPALRGRAGILAESVVAAR